MALKLTVILLLLLFAVLKFGGRDTGGSPFAELPGAEPAEVLLSVAPLDVPLEAAPPPGETASSPAPGPVDSRPALADPAPAAPETDTASRTGTEDAAVPTPGQSALDMIVMDPAAARDSLSLAPPAAINATGPLTLAPTATPATATGSDINRAEVTGSAVNLRAGPSTGDAILGRAIQGDVVEWVANPTPGWALIRHPDIDGDLYMSSQFLRRIGN